MPRPEREIARPCNPTLHGIGPKAALSIKEGQFRVVGERLGRLVESSHWVDHAKAMDSLALAGRALGLPVRQSRAIASAAMWTGRHVIRDGGELPTEAENRRTIRLLGDAIATRTWKGRKAQTRRNLLIAALSIADEAGKVYFQLSLRQWAEEAGCEASTVSNHTPWLAPWILPVRERYFPGFATMWVLGCPDFESLVKVGTECSPVPVDESETTTAPPRLPRRGSITRADQDIHHRSVYGPQIHWWTHGRTEAFTVREVSLSVGASRDTVRRQLKRLAGFGFVERDAETTTLWRTVPGPGDPVALAAVTPYRRRKEARHAVQREWFHGERVLDPDTGEILDYWKLDLSDRAAVEAFWMAREHSKGWK